MQSPVAAYSSADASPLRAAVADKPAQGAISVELSHEALVLVAKLKARDTQMRQHE